MDTPRGDDFTAAVVALKARDQAKSRLGSLPDDFRRELATAMAVDTLKALSAAVDHVLVVGRVPSHVGHSICGRQSRRSPSRRRRD